MNDYGVELFTAWNNLLRSENYRQIDGLLRDDGSGRCCLGVLCDLSTSDDRFDLVGGSWVDEYNEDDGMPFLFNGECRSNMPPNTLTTAMAAKMGCDDNNLQDYFSTLANANDSGFSFEEIATINDWMIEKRTIYCDELINYFMLVNTYREL